MEDLGSSSASQNKRLAIWLIACVAVMVGWGYIAPRPTPPPPDRAATPVAAPEDAAAAPAAAPAAATIPGVAEGFEAAAPPSAEPAVEETEKRRLTARTGAFEVELSNVGGRITSWKLPSHGDYGAADRPLELVRRRTAPVTAAAASAPASDVPPVSPSTLPASDAQDVLPLQVVTGDAALDARLAKALYAISAETVDGRQVLTARWSDGNGTSVEKILTLLPDDPLATLQAKLTVAGKPVPFHLAWGPGLCNHTAADHSNMYFQRGNVGALQGGDVRLVERADKKKDADALASTPAAWAALQDSYFAILFTPHALAGAPDGKALGGAETGYRVAGTVPTDAKGKPDKRAWPEELILEVPFTPDAPVQTMYVGPRDRPTLAKLEGRFATPPALTMLTHLGWLDGIARLLHVPMIKFHAWTGSWGLSVILLTLLVRVVIGPMQFYSMRKMRAMQDKMKPMQAQLKALEERYKKQPPTRESRIKHMEEKQELMLKAGVNPGDMMSGCLPMLITMPAFFALFRLLPNAPEFRHQSFLLWHDLAAADPTHLLPFAAAALTLISTKMGMSSSPGAIDPMQRNMLYMFPLMLVWICWSAPLAFVVYQVAMSAVQIGQQQLFNTILSPSGDAARTRPGMPSGGEPAAETARASAGNPGNGEARKKGRKR